MDNANGNLSAMLNEFADRFWKFSEESLDRVGYHKVKLENISSAGLTDAIDWVDTQVIFLGHDACNAGLIIIISVFQLIWAI